MKFTRVFAFMALAGLAGSAFATNGYFSHGYGMKSKGMAGASSASYDDAFFGANNPAAAAFAGNRADLGADLFMPIREASDSNFGGSGIAVTSESDSEMFLVPEFGYNRMINNNLALGVTVYGNGGMNSDYPDLGAAFGNTNIMFGSQSLGVDLMQLIVAPTAAYRIAPNHSLGIAPLLGYQRFAATGLQAFSGFSMNPAALSENGHDDAFGWGVRIGYMGKLTPNLTIGAAYASKMDFEEFEDYAGLFAEEGDFDIPENYNLGVAWQATPSIKLALDYQRISYSGVDSVSNPVSNLLVLGQPLGSDNGPGFGWDDIDVWKFGVEYKHSPQWTLRAGYSHNDNPINGSDLGEAFLNILAPAVIEDHMTLGFTYTLASGNEVTMAYMHGFETEVSGTNPLTGSTDTIQMYQDSIGIQYSWKM